MSQSTFLSLDFIIFIIKTRTGLVLMQKPKQSPDSDVSSSSSDFNISLSAGLTLKMRVKPWREEEKEIFIFMGEIKMLQASLCLSARPEVFIILAVTDTLTRLSQITDKLRN